MLALIALAFFGPTVVALVLVESGWRPGGRVNHGELVNPVEPMAALPLAESGAPADPALWLGRWSLLLSSAQACASRCEETLSLLGRVHVALNKDQDRVQVGLVLPGGTGFPALPERVLRLHAPAPLLRDWAELAGAGEDGMTVQLVDYRGQRMMSFPTPLDGSGLLKDLRRLLRLSKEEVERMSAEGVK